jgi:DNA polymerase elongation subunit (family B)
MALNNLSRLPVGTVDLETDPFEPGVIPQPFAGCVYIPGLLKEPAVFWNENPTELIPTILKFIERLPRKVLLYAHNGGKFDSWYFLPYAPLQELRIIKPARILMLEIKGAVIVDSYPLVPIPLAQYDKDKIDYMKFQKGLRSIYREEITRYLVKDCTALYELITGLHAELGRKWTIGSAAFKQLKALGYEPPRLTKTQDETLRPYYYGGRTEALKPGIWNGPELVSVDINSAYPKAMQSEHPWSIETRSSRKMPIELGPQFLTVEGVSRGAFPYRDKNGLHFPRDNESRLYNITGWELESALETNTFKLRELIKATSFTETTSFRDYVSKYYKMKADAKRKGDKIREIVGKLLLNSCYGKFALNPLDFREYKLLDALDWPGFGGWVPELEVGDYMIWSRPKPNEEGFYHVGVSASITGYVRAYLWRSICAARDVYYCDTDSMICRDPGTIAIGDKLGQWKIEGKGRTLYVAGKKLYAFKTGKECARLCVDCREQGFCADAWKRASKGCGLTPAEIAQVAKGETVTWRNKAPTFGLNGAVFIERDISKTA